MLIEGDNIRQAVADIQSLSAFPYEVLKRCDHLAVGIRRNIVVRLLGAFASGGLVFRLIHFGLNFRLNNRLFVHFGLVHLFLVHFGLVHLLLVHLGLNFRLGEI